MKKKIITKTRWTLKVDGSAIGGFLEKHWKNSDFRLSDTYFWVVTTKRYWTPLVMITVPSTCCYVSSKELTNTTWLIRTPGVSDPNYSIDTARLWGNRATWPRWELLALLWCGIVRGDLDRGTYHCCLDRHPPPLYTWLKFSRKVLLHVLSRDPDSQVRLPTVENAQFYQAAIGEKYPLCADVWEAADSLKLLIQSTEDESKQNKNYNGWTHGHYINGWPLIVYYNIKHKHINT